MTDETKATSLVKDSKAYHKDQSLNEEDNYNMILAIDKVKEMFK
jgi:hypothetical protein